MYPGDLNYLASVGWLIDRTAEKKEVIGSAWKIKEDEVVTCANLILPFMDYPDALAIEFPLTNERYGVQDYKFHNFFDRWISKRNLQESGFYPNIDLQSAAYNVAGIKLSESPKRLDRDTLARLKKSVIFNHIKEEPDLTGQADNMQIVSILQTLMNARNIGTMLLIDDEDKVLARFGMGDQKITHIQFQNLTNEDALNKLICTLEGEMRFHFVREFEPEWTDFPALEKPTAGLLMKAYSIMEEATKLYGEVGGKEVEIKRITEELALDNLTEDQCPPVACIWNHIKFPISISRVARCCNFDGATVLNAMKYLVASGQAQIGKFDPPEMSASMPLTLAEDLDFKKGWEVFALSIDHTVSKGSIDMGYILDPIYGAESQYIHTIGLPLEACGSPIIQNDRVLGIHSGPLVKGFDTYREWIHPGIMITADAIYDCMGIARPRKETENTQMETLNQDDDETLFEVKTIDASERLTIDEQEESMVLNENESEEAEDEENDEIDGVETVIMKPEEKKALRKGTLELDKLSGFFKSVTGLIQTIGVSGEGLDVTLMRQSLDSEKYEKSNANKKLLIGDFIRLKIKVLSECSMFVLFRAGPEQPIEFLYPPENETAVVEKGKNVDIPTNTISMVSAGVMQTYSGIPLNFNEQDSEIVITFSFGNSLNLLFNDNDDKNCIDLFNSLREEKNLEFKKYLISASEINRADNDQVDKSESEALFACHMRIKA